MQQNKPTDLALYLRLLAYVKPYLKIFLVAVLAMAVLALTSPAIAALFKNITEGVFQLSEINLVTHVIVPIILVFLVAAVASYISRYALAWVADRLVMDLRMEMFSRLLSVPCAGLDRHSAGSLISRFTFDAAQLKEAATNVITTLSRDTLSIIGTGGLDGLARLGADAGCVPGRAGDFVGVAAVAPALAQDKPAGAGFHGGPPQCAW